LKDKYNIAIVGATGLVGETMLEILAERNFPIGDLHALASSNSVGKSVRCGDKRVKVKDLADFDFAGVDIALFSAGGSVSEIHAPRAGDVGCIAIDNTSHFRNEPDVPLVVPEVNPEALAEYGARNIIASPNCSTIQMVVALKPIYDAVGIDRINVATYQAVSGAGRGLVESLAGQTAGLLNGRPVELEGDEKPIAFNVIPHIDAFMDNDYTREEMKMVWETRKILDDEAIMINPTAVRVPVFYGHSEAVHIETREKISAAQVRALLASAPGISVLDEARPGGYPTPVTEAAKRDEVFVGRIREDISHDHGINLWIVGDNVRKGAALNTIQIAEILVSDYI
jgi:aspartate-semialdehyde dehydrogenase